MPNKLFEKQKDEINNELPSRDFKIEDYDIESSKIITNNLCDEDLNILSYRLNKDKWFLYIRLQILLLNFINLDSFYIQYKYRYIIKV